MSIYLGNLGVGQISERMGIPFPDELVVYMDGTHQDNAGTLESGKWHCFDLPFVLVCENREMAVKIYEYLKPFVKDIKVPLQISLQTGRAKEGTV